MPPTKCSTSAAYCWMVCEHVLQDPEASLWKHLWRKRTWKEKLKTGQNCNRNQDQVTEGYKKRKRFAYSSAGAIRVKVGESTAVKRFLNVRLSGRRPVPSDLQQVVLKTQVKLSARVLVCAHWKVRGARSKRRQHRDAYGHKGSKTVAEPVARRAACRLNSMRELR